MRRDLAGLPRACGIPDKTRHGGATVSGRRLSKQAPTVLRGDPSGGPNTPAPAVDSRIHQHGRWPAASSRLAPRSPRNPNFTRPYREAPTATAQRAGHLRIGRAVRGARQQGCRFQEQVQVCSHDFTGSLVRSTFARSTVWPTLGYRAFAAHEFGPVRNRAGSPLRGSCRASSDGLSKVVRPARRSIS